MKAAMEPTTAAAALSEVTMPAEDGVAVVGAGVVTVADVADDSEPVDVAAVVEFDSVPTVAASVLDEADEEEPAVVVADEELDAQLVAHLVMSSGNGVSTPSIVQ
jgi:hypothetical protein